MSYLLLLLTWFLWAAALETAPNLEAVQARLHAVSPKTVVVLFDVSGSMEKHDTLVNAREATITLLRGGSAGRPGGAHRLRRSSPSAPGSADHRRRGSAGGDRCGTGPGLTDPGDEHPVGAPAGAQEARGAPSGAQLHRRRHGQLQRSAGPERPAHGGLPQVLQSEEPHALPGHAGEPGL